MFFVTVDIIQHKSYKVNRITIDLTFLLKYALIDRITMNNRTSIKSMRNDKIVISREVQK